MAALRLESEKSDSALPLLHAARSGRLSSTHTRTHGMSSFNAVSLRAPNTRRGAQAHVKAWRLRAERKGSPAAARPPALLRHTRGPGLDAGPQCRREVRRGRCEMPTRLTLRTLRGAPQVLAQRAEASGEGMSLCGALHVQNTIPRHTTGNAPGVRMQGTMGGGGALVCGSAP